MIYRHALLVVVVVAVAFLVVRAGAVPTMLRPHVRVAPAAPVEAVSVIHDHPAKHSKIGTHQPANHSKIGALTVSERKHGVCGVNFKCVVSYSLYGPDNPRYSVGAIRNAQLVKEVYEGWVVRFYYEKDVVNKVLVRDLINLGAEMVPIGKVHGAAGMFARFKVSEDDTVDRYIVRDADSRLSMREKHAVDAWIKSGYAVHELRDHPSHCRTMNGGMWGGTKGAIKDISGLMSKFHQVNYNDDQNFLSTIVWNLIKDNQISHDSCCCTQFPNAHPFPTRRIGWEHVGAVIDLNEAPRAGDTWRFLNYKKEGIPRDQTAHWENPPKCRLKPEWTHG
jgi:hypothetical protein